MIGHSKSLVPTYMYGQSGFCLNTRKVILPLYAELAGRRARRSNAGAEVVLWRGLPAGSGCSPASVAGAARGWLWTGQLALRAHTRDTRRPVCLPSPSPSGLLHRASLFLACCRSPSDAIAASNAVCRVTSHSASDQDCRRGQVERRGISAAVVIAELTFGASATAAAAQHARRRLCLQPRAWASRSTALQVA